MNKIDLQGRNAVVTGGARGIGLAIAQRLLASGAQCSLWDLDAEALRAAVKALEGGGAVQTAVVNVTQPESVHSAADNTRRHFGAIDILVNNAGIAGATKKTWDLTPAEWQEVLQVDLFVVFLYCHAVVPGMIESTTVVGTTPPSPVVSIQPGQGKTSNVLVRLFTQIRSRRRANSPSSKATPT